MPTPAASLQSSRPEDLIVRLNSTHTPFDTKLKALRDLKNQIIGNPTKKVAFLKLQAVPSVVSIMSSASAGAGELYDSLLIQSAATIGSFSCGLEAGVKAVLDAGAFPLLLSLITHANDKVSDAGARSLKLIYQSVMAPKYDFLLENNMDFLMSLLNSKNENVSGLGASIIAHSCQTTVEQHVLCEAGVIKRLIYLLRGSLIQRDAGLESLAAMIKDNPDVASNFMRFDNGMQLNFLVDLVKDKHPRTRLLACMCLTNLRNSSASYLQDPGIKTKLVLVLLELLDDPGQVGDEAPFVLSCLISEKEDMQKIAFDTNVVDKLCEHLTRASFQAKRLQGIYLALADLCSKLECCRDRVLHLEVMSCVTEALDHDSSVVRSAACFFLQNVTRSVKNLSAGQFMNEAVVVPLIQLLCDSSSTVQVAALVAVSNVVVDFTAHKTLFVQCGGLKQLVQLSKSMESAIRVNAVWGLRNLAFLANKKFKEEVLLELTTPTLISLISDPEVSVQEQALALVRNLVDGNLSSTEYVLREDGLLLHSIGNLLKRSSKVELLLQGTCALSNIASGNESQKEEVMNQLLPQGDDTEKETIIIKFLHSNDSRLRTATLWAIVNLTFPGCPGVRARVTKLQAAGILPLLKNMFNDSCLDVKLRAKTAIGQFMVFGDASL